MPQCGMIVQEEERTQEEETQVLITSEVRPVNYRGLMKKVEQVVAAMDRADDIGATIHTLLEIIIVKFRDELGITGGRLYQRRGESYILQATFAAARRPRRAPPRTTL